MMTDVIEYRTTDKEPGRPRRKWRDLAVGVVALVVALLVGSWIGESLAPSVTVDTTCHQIGQPNEPGSHQIVHARPGSFVGRGCNIR